MRDNWRAATEMLRPPRGPNDPPYAPSELELKADDLAAEVRRLVANGRATPEDMRVAATVLDSVRDQLRHILRG